MKNNKTYTSLYERFDKPPRGYGNVPFYWWNGDHLECDRIDKQLRLLAEGGVSGVQINFCHYCPEHNPSKKGGGFGQTYDSDPKMFSDEWWEIVNHTFHTAARLGIGVGISDYTLGWIGNGYFVDNVVYDAGLCATELQYSEKSLKAGEAVESRGDDVLERVLISQNAPVYPDGEQKTANAPFDCILAEVRKVRNKDSIDVTNPEAGKLLCRLFYENFLSHLDEECRNVLNYCFQDEFIAGCDFGCLWSENFSQIFKAAKGYDIIPLLHLLFTDGGNRTVAAQLRLDYADVKASIIEKSYFEPIYEFHHKRGLIYGCDQCSRGYNPAEYGDYFRAVKYFTAPGNDTPDRFADLIKVKTSSSIAHLYGHDRVWLEGYHSSGWGTSLASLSEPTSENFIYGANLLCMHGLYYATYGGFWEWAPPDFHFRMPYWKHASAWFRYYERLAYLLSQGKHRCDCAVYYPVSAYDTGFSHERAEELTFAAADRLHKAGIDFDFIDFESIDRAAVKDGRLCVSGEEYKLLLFCGVDSVRSKTLGAALDFAVNGGTVIFVGELPLYSDGACAEETEKLLSELTKRSILLKADSGESLRAEAFAEIFDVCSIPRDFKADGNTFALHRVTDCGDVYFVRGAKGQRCTFDCEGHCELWNSGSGEKYAYPTARLSNLGHEMQSLLLPCGGDNLFFFSTEKNDVPNYRFEKEERCSVMLDGEWDFSLIPTLDNTYGDFRMPAGRDGGDMKIGAEIRRLKIDGGDAVCGMYKPFVRVSETETTSPLVYDRHGFLDGALSEQGYHGLKKCVYNFNIALPAHGGAEYDSFTFTEDETYVIFALYGVMPDSVQLDGREVMALEGAVLLPPGEHSVRLIYKEKNRAITRAGVFLRKIDKTDAVSVDMPYKFYSFDSMEEASVKNSVSGIPLTNDWFARQDCLRLTSGHSKKMYSAEFHTAPGTEEIIITIFGKIESVTSDGSETAFDLSGITSYGAAQYRIKLSRCEYGNAVAVKVNPQSGFTDGDMFPEPIREVTGFGRITTGDLSEVSGLECYSGIAVYETGFAIDCSGDEIEKDGCRLILELGEVACTAQVSINDKTVDVLCSAPFVTDITDYICKGQNKLKIEVANTLCGYYSTSPSLYSGWPEDRASGLIGPVKLRFVKVDTV